MRLAPYLLIAIVFSLLLTGACLYKAQNPCNIGQRLVGGACCPDIDADGTCDVVAQQSAVSSVAPTAESPDMVASGNEFKTITRIIDSQTIRADDGTTIVLAGIRAPAKGEAFYAAALGKLRELTLGKQVQLDGVGTTDSGHLKRYVFVGGYSVNQLLLSSGYAQVLDPDPRYENALRTAEYGAYERRTGIWTPPWELAERTCDDRCLYVESLSYTSYYHDECVFRNDEFVTLKNVCGKTCNLTGWTLTHEGNERYVFPAAYVYRNESITVYSGEGTDTSTDFYWNNTLGICKTVWKNDGDTLFLYDIDGNLALKHRYLGMVWK